MMNKQILFPIIALHSFVIFSNLDFSCSTPVILLDVHADVSGDISKELVTFTHAVSFAHSTNFLSQHKGVM
jgi:hypothetical protein